MKVLYIITFFLICCYVTTLIVLGCSEILQKIRSIKKHYDELAIYRNQVNRESFYNKALNKNLTSAMLQFPNIDYIDIAKNNYNCFTKKTLDLIQCYNLRKKEAQKRLDDANSLCDKLQHILKNIKISNVFVFSIVGVISCFVFINIFPWLWVGVIFSFISTTIITKLYYKKIKELFLYPESDYILFKVKSHNDTVYGDFMTIYQDFDGILSNCTKYGYSYHSLTEKSPLREYLDYPEYVVDWENGLPHTDDNRWFRYISFGGCCYHADVHCKAIRGSKSIVHILNLLTENDENIVKGYFNHFSNEFSFTSRETRTHKYKPCKLCKTEEVEVPKWYSAYGIIWLFNKTLTKFNDTITKMDPDYFLTSEDGLTYEQRYFIEKLKRDRR